MPFVIAALSLIALGAGGSALYVRLPVDTQWRVTCATHISSYDDCKAKGLR